MGKKKSVSDEELKVIIDFELAKQGTFTSKVLQKSHLPDLSLVTIYGLLDPFVKSGYLKKDPIAQNSKYDARIEYSRTKRIRKEDVVMIVSRNMEMKINEIHGLLFNVELQELLFTPKLSFWNKIVKWFDRMGW